MYNEVRNYIWEMYRIDAWNSTLEENLLKNKDVLLLIHNMMVQYYNIKINFYSNMKLLFGEKIKSKYCFNENYRKKRKFVKNRSILKNKEKKIRWKVDKNKTKKYKYKGCTCHLCTGSKKMSKKDKRLIDLSEHFR